MAKTLIDLQTGQQSSDVVRVLNGSSEGIIVTDVHGTIQAIDHVFTMITGYELHEVIGQNPRILKSNVHNKKFYEQLWQTLETQHTWTGHIWNRRKDGSTYLQHTCINAVKNTDGVVTHYVAVISDATNADNGFADLQYGKDLYYQYLDVSPDIVLIHDQNSIIYANNAAVSLLGAQAVEDIIGKHVLDFVSQDARKSFAKRLENSNTQMVDTTEEKFVRLDGQIIEVQTILLPVVYGGQLVTQIVARDLTNYKQSQQQIEYLKHHDALVGIPNRLSLYEDLNRHMQKTQNKQMAVLLIDIDRFKRINDTFGHPSGDKLLCELAQRFASVLNKTHTLYRLGGDEFVVVAPNIKQIHDSARVAQKLLKSLNQPFIMDGNEIFMSASIGIAVYPNDGTCPQQLMKNAHAAVSRAKDLGRSIYQMYDPSMNAKAFERLILESHMCKAIDQKQLVLYFQPKVSVATNKIVGLESLIRWQHPEFGLISPLEFIPLAEETGLIIPIGEWVIRTACMQNKTWQKAGFSPVRISVNVSALQLQPDLEKVIYKALQDSNLDPKYLEIEITESTIVNDPEFAIYLLNQLKSKGIHVAIDDFGVKYSSLNYLKQLPADFLKIDRSFVSDIVENPNHAAITKAIIDLALTLNLRVTAEGVQSHEQLEMLKSFGCTEVQGYLFSPPVTEEQIRLFLKNN